MPRPALSYVDPNEDRAEMDRDVVTSIQDLAGQELTVTTPATPDAEFLVPHKLRKSPLCAETLRTTTGGVLYASRFSEWNDRRIFLKFTKGADTVLLRLR